MILETRNLSVEYRIGVRWLNALYDIALQIRAHEIHGLVGESGSGKSTLALTVMRYLQPNARIANGSILFNNVDIAQRSQTDMAAIWGKQIALVPQNPLEALNPTLTIGAQMTEVTRLHLGLSAADARQQAIEDLQKVKIADAQTILGRYPHQLSGGMQQRVMIATALSTHPQLLILDVPTTALDVTTQAVILDLLRMRVRESGASALYVSHNLGTIAQLCDSVTVLYGGEVMESAPVRTIFHQALHPYTRGLLESIPSPSQVNEARLTTIGGVAPSLAERAIGCAFATRCPIAIAKCHSEKPPTEAVSDAHSLRCWRWHEIAEGSVAPHNRVTPPEYQAPARADVVLTVRNLSKTFREDSLWRRLMGKPADTVLAVGDVNLHVNGRSTLGVVGESGSGKTTLARSIVALTPADSGTIELLERPISLELRQRDAATLQNLRLIFQNPNDALNPRRTVGQTIGRTLQRLTDRKRSAKEIEKEVGELLVSIGLAPEYARRYPGQLSGGEKQRVAIARAFAASPALIIADEPTSALDVSVQAVIVNLLKDLRTRAGLSYVVISHDLELIGYLAEWIAVMYLGEIVEQGTTADVYGIPSHPYTEALVSAIPVANPDAKRGVIRLDGDVPSPRHKPSGCPFHTRCPRYIGDICVTQEPPLREDANGHHIRCHYTLAELTALQTPVEGSAL